MRMRVLLPVALGAVVLAAVAGQAAVGASRDSAYSDAARRLEATWQQDVADGVPASAIDPLRGELAATSAPNWLSSDWWRNTPQQELVNLQSRTQEVWDTALADARDQADSVLADARDFVKSAGSLAPTPFVAGVETWPQAIADAPTPAAVAELAAQEGSSLADARAQVRAAQAAIAAQQAAALAAAQAAAVQQAGGVDQLLTAVGDVDQTASNDNLDSSAVDNLAAEVRAEVAAGQPTTVTGSQLVAAITTFRQTVATNDKIAAAMQPLQWEIEQAVVEGTPGSAGFVPQFQPLEKAFTDARTADQITAVDQSQSALKAAVDKDLAAGNCGHSVPAGKVLVVSLSAQEMVAYQDGCAVRATPVTTGRPQLPTPAGTFHVFYKTSPFTMVSPWPQPSPFWYPTTTVAQVMEFDWGGYFIHDADWESPSAYGPGSENNPYAASHGCIHVPTPTMQWLYSWTPVGTEVIVEA
jgi:L,D-transpeptidase-like protein